MTDRLLRGCCLEILPILPADSVQLVVTSPPYNVGWDYGDGGAGDLRPLPEYLDLLARALAGCYRALRPGGVLALNVPETIGRPTPKTRTGARDPRFPRLFPLAAWAQMHLLERGWLAREPPAWAKSKSEVEAHATGTAIGNYRNPYLRPTFERVLVASKQRYEIPERGHRWPGDDAAFRGYMEWCKDLWPLKPGRARPGEPLAFPDELVSRLVKLYSNPGDVVLDPYAGNGTTARVARLLGREAWLIEREPACWPRLAAVLGQGVLVAVP